MNSQVLHILGKDIRGQFAGILLVLGAALLVITTEVLMGSLQMQNPVAAVFVLLVAGAYLIARVVHAEALANDREFWLTRPYRWHNLLAAKLLFIFLFVNLPIVLSRLIMLHLAGFPPAAILPGLAAWQLLLFLTLELPIAALAALTHNVRTFTVSVIFVWSLAIAAIIASNPFSHYAGLTLPLILQHVRSESTLWIAATGSVTVLYLQYRKRWTVISRVCAAGFVIVSVAGPSLAPVSMEPLPPGSCKYTAPT